MKRLTKNEKDKIITLIKDGASLNKISKLTGKAKSTLYYHYEQIKGKKCKPINFNLSEEDLGEFLGIFAGDGGFYLDKNYKYKISFYTGFSDKEYNQSLISFFSQLFNKAPDNYSRKSDHIFILCYRSKDIYKLIKNYLEWEGKKTYSVKLKDLSHSKPFYLGFLRGLFDTDGNFYAPKKRISYGTVSKNLALQIKNMFLDLGFNPSYYIAKNPSKADFHRISLSGQNALKFIKIINPRNKRKINTAVI